MPNSDHTVCDVSQRKKLPRLRTKSLGTPHGSCNCPLQSQPEMAATRQWVPGAVTDGMEVCTGGGCELGRGRGRGGGTLSGGVFAAGNLDTATKSPGRVGGAP